MAEEIAKDVLSSVNDWYVSLVGHTELTAAKRYVVCAGLAVLEHAIKHFPLESAHYITSGNQVKTGGPFIRNILRRYGERRVFASEGGRTTRGTRVAAEQLANAINDLPTAGVLASMSEDERKQVFAVSQQWLVDRAREYFNQQSLRVEIDVDKPAPLIIRDILTAASKQRLAGPVAHHLVGAKLALRFPHLQVPNRTFTAADQQTDKPGDYRLNDTVFHVTAAPMPALFEKVKDNLRNHFRVKVLVTENKIATAAALAEEAGIAGQLDISSVERFVGPNVEELSEYRQPALAEYLSALLRTYNQRVQEVETDRSILIDIPDNLPQ